MPTAQTDLRRVRQNVADVRARVGPGVGIWATIKADAYSLGAAAVALAVRDAVEGFCVFALEEARAIDLWKLTGREAIAMGPPSTLDPEPYLAARVRPAVSTVEQARALRTARPVLCADTGMQRFACPPERVDEVLQAGGIDEAFTHATRLEHVRMLEALVGGKVARRHAAATALLGEPAAHLDAVRPGLALYRGALRVAAPLLEARDSRGPIGYTGWTSPTGRHGVIRAGYSDGLRPGPALVNGRRQQITEVGMQTAYVTLAPQDRPGDTVVLLGDGLTEADVAYAWNATPHQVLVTLGKFRA